MGEAMLFRLRPSTGIKRGEQIFRQLNMRRTYILTRGDRDSQKGESGGIVGRKGERDKQIEAIMISAMQ